MKRRGTANRPRAIRRRIFMGLILSTISRLRTSPPASSLVDPSRSGVRNKVGRSSRQLPQEYISMSKKVQFTLFSPQGGQSWHQVEERAHRCEKLGFHSIWLVDHMWSPRMLDLDHHECMALMAGLAAKTEKIRIGTMVICNSYRNPALLAKSLATIDH